MPDNKKKVSDISNQSEAERYRYLQLLNRNIEQMFNTYIDAIVNFTYAQSINPNKIFTFVNYPNVRSYVDAVVNSAVAEVNLQIVNGIDYGWSLSNQKNNLIADVRLADSLIPKGKQITFYDANFEAKRKFIQRTEAGLNLSQRIYKAVQPFSQQLEQGLALHIGEGKSAAETGRKLKQYLKEPNALVQDKIKARNVGSGVYRSATANIERLTRTEINNSYRSADLERWAATPFILGFEVRLSAQHPKYDICDPMAGQYPKSFVFSGWHPQCLCYSVPVLMNDKQFGEYQQLVLSGNDTQENVFKIASPVLEIPATAAQWVEDNIEKISRLKNTPYWFKDNSGRFPKLKRVA